MKDVSQSPLWILNSLLTVGFLILVIRLWIKSRRPGQSANSAGEDYGTNRGPHSTAEFVDDSEPGPEQEDPKILNSDQPGRAVELLSWLQAGAIRLKNWPVFAITDLQEEGNRWILTSLLPGFLLSGALLLYFGQALLTVPLQNQRWIAWMYITGGFILFITGANSYSRKKIPAVLAALFQKISTGLLPAQLLLLASAPALSYAASLLAGFEAEMHQPWQAAAAWIGAILSLILGSLRFPVRITKPDLPIWEIAAALAIFGLGAFLRLSNLSEIPWLLTGDEGSAGLTAVQFINGERNNIFTTGWFAFPSLFYFLQSLPIRLFGNTITSLRLSSALMGSLTVLATYWAARTVYGRWTALFASAFMASFNYHIHFSRIGLNNIYDGFFFIVAFGTAIRFYRHRRAVDAVLTGMAVGLSQYFYSSSKVLIILLIAWLILVLLPRRSKLRRSPQMILILLALMVVILPLGRFYLQNPNDLRAPFQRVRVIPENESLSALERITEILPDLKDQLTASLSAFTVTNLRMWYNSEQPMLLTLPAALFLLGLGIMLVKSPDPAVTWLLLWLASAVGISILSKDAPAPQRLPYTAPGVSIIIALTLQQVADWLAGLWPRFRHWILGAACLLLAMAMSSDIGYYFYDYVPNQYFGDLNTEVAHQVGLMLSNKPEGTSVYFLGGRMGYHSHSSIPYLAPQCSGTDLMDTVIDPPALDTYQETIFIILPEREDEVEVLVRAYPHGEQRLYYGKNETLFLAYTIPPSY